MKITFLTILLLVVSVLPVQSSAITGIHSRTGDITHVERVEVDRDPETGEYVVRIFTTGQRPGFSESVPWGISGVSIELKKVRLSQSYTQSSAAGPLMAYNLVQDQENVLVRLSFLTDNIKPSIYWSEKSSAILITLKSSDLKSPPTVVAIAQPTYPVEQYAVGMPAPEVSSSESQGARNTPPVDFRSRLLATARDLSDGRTPMPYISSGKWKLDTIVLDAGHGGWDEGAVGHNGLMEKDLALLIVRKLGSRIEHELGIRVVYTRTEDSFIPLVERGRIANQYGGKLFISIHANQAYSRNAHGTETYFLGIHRGDSARVVMERENEIIRLEENAHEYGSFDAEELAMRRISQSANLQQSEKLAALVEESFSESAGRKSRGVKQAGFYVLFGASMPSVLVELGFLSNSKEESYLNSREGQAALTESIFLAVSRFRAEYEKGLSITVH
ncbi:MAG: N-acetylmuramoyl-L-alanine amidase [Bacteroidetes bacterium]|nr:MAG: N-acetylmuramoyl-L-alanine amidase [Bacteroidota bacterium]